MEDEQLASLAQSWVEYYKLPIGSEARRMRSEAVDYFDLLGETPEALWQLILKIHAYDRSPEIQQVLSAGPIEDLLAQHGEGFIDRIESMARNDPDFARVLGGVWQNGMSDAVWQRVQAVWDRRGWDGIPE